MGDDVFRGVCFGIGLGWMSARFSDSWRAFWRGIVTLLLFLAAFALGVLALDTFGWSLPLGRYLAIWLVMVPVVVAVGAARLASLRRYAARRRREGLRPVAVEKQPPRADR